MGLIQLPRQFSPDFSRPGFKPAGPVEVDRSNLFGQHVSAFITANNGIPANLVNSDVATSNGQAKVIATTRGQVLSFDGNGDRLSFPTVSGLDALGSEPYAVVWRINQTSFIDSFATIATFDTGSTNVWEMFYTDSAAYKEVAFSQTGTGGFKAGFELPGTATATLGEHLGIFAYNGQGVDTLANYTLWFDGEEFAAGTTSTLSNATNQGIEIGSTANFGTADLNGSTEFVGWLQGLNVNAGMARDFTRDPYQLLKPSISPVYFPAAAVSGITGTGAFTLDDVTVASTGTVDIDGAGAFTFTDVTTTSVGTVSITGSSAFTLDDVTLSSTGIVGAISTGTAVFTLDDVTTTSVGTVDVDGTATFTLSDVTTTATGTIAIDGSGAFTLEDLTVSASDIVIAADVQIDGADTKVLNTDFGFTTLYFSNKDGNYFSI